MSSLPKVFHFRLKSLEFNLPAVNIDFVLHFLAMISSASFDRVVLGPGCCLNILCLTKIPLGLEYLICVHIQKKYHTTFDLPVWFLKRFLTECALKRKPTGALPHRQRSWTASEWLLIGPPGIFFLCYIWFIKLRRAKLYLEPWETKASPGWHLGQALPCTQIAWLP